MTVTVTAPELAQQAADGARPPLAASLSPLDFTQVAFAGHNQPDDLGDRRAAAAGLKAAFGLLGQAGVRHGRLLTGAQPGADRLAIAAWRAQGLGAVHVVSPFLDDPAGAADDLTEGVTMLDGTASRADGRSPHLAQARWLIGAADILVVVWSGRPPRGPGGTGDTVRLALEHGTPVLWVQPGASCVLRLIRPEYLDEDFGLLELLQQLAAGRQPLVIEATPETVHTALVDLGLEARPEHAASEEAAGDAQAPGPWRTYGVFRRFLGGRPQPLAAPPPAPADLAAQPGFATLTAARAAAAHTARRLASIHRSQQVILLAVAILAATAGSAPALLPQWKTAMVALEFFLAVLAFIVWLGSERGARHLRWTEARKLAEDLRLERVAWTLGVSTVSHGLHPTSSIAARRERRLAGVPSGAFDEVRVGAWGAWAIDELITGQVAYHRAQARIDGRISHRVHQVENASFALLILALLAYLAAAALLAATHDKPPHWLAGVVMMTGAIVPAIGAAGLALEATLSLGEQARRSRALADQLEALKAQMEPPQTLERAQAVARAALRLHRAQEDHWSQEVGRRRLFRGG